MEMESDGGWRWRVMDMKSDVMFRNLPIKIKIKDTLWSGQERALQYQVWLFWAEIGTHIN
jgi:hypothetical protein